MASPSVDTALVLDHAELRAENPVEFRRLLDHIREAAGLNCGQIAVKTGMPRSQAYNLVSKSRPTLPSRRDQVAAFVKACNLAPVQVDIVLDLWTTLNDEQLQQRAQARAANGGVEDAGTQRSLEALRLLLDSSSLADENITINRGPGSDIEPTSHVNVFVDRSEQQLPSNARLIDLVHYLVANDQRLHRALRLLYPFVALAVVIIAGLVALAIWQPSAASSMSIALGGLLLPVVILARTRRVRR